MVLRFWAGLTHFASSCYPRLRDGLLRPVVHVLLLRPVIHGSEVGCLGLAREAPTLSEAARTMAKLSETTPKIKKLVVEAAAAATGADGAVTVEEAELLRAVFAGLDVPAPPAPASST